MGCYECERLRNEFNAIIQRNAELLGEFQAAVMDLNKIQIDRLRLALLDAEEKRREARIALLAHDATHRTMSAAG
jgi:hypothetical protein